MEFDRLFVRNVGGETRPSHLEEIAVRHTPAGHRLVLSQLAPGGMLVLGYRAEAASSEPSSAQAVVELEVELEVHCPTCGVSGDDPCVTAGGKVKDKPHAARP